MFCNKFKNSQNSDIQITYSGTRLIRSPMAPQNLAVLMGWPYYRGYFYKKMYGGSCQAAEKRGHNNEVTVLTRWL